MNLRKPLIILGGLLLVLLIWLTVRAIFFKDEVKPALANLIYLNQEMIKLSEEAANDLQTFNLQVSNANVGAVISSDNRTLAAYFRAHHGKKIPKATLAIKDATGELEDAQPGPAYEQRYLSLINDLKTNAQQLSQSLIAQTNQSELDRLLDNYHRHLQELFVVQ